MLRILFLMLTLGFVACSDKKENSSSDNVVFIPAKVENKYGYMNANGELVIPARFQDVRDFSEGLAAVREDENYGFINTSGDYVIEPIYDGVESFSSGLALVYTMDESKIMDTNINRYWYTYIGSAGEYKFIDNTGKTCFIVPKNTYEKVFPFENDFAIVESDGNNFGLINSIGELMVDTIFYLFEKIDSGKYIAATEVWFFYLIDGYKGVINSFGDTLIPFNYQDISYTGTNYICAYETDRFLISRFDIYDKNCSLIYSCEGVRNMPYESGPYIVIHRLVGSGNSLEERTFETVLLSSDCDTTIFISQGFERVCFPFDEAGFIKNKDEWKMVNLQGDLISDKIFTRIVDDNIENNPLIVQTATPKKNQEGVRPEYHYRWHFVDRSGKLFPEQGLDMGDNFYIGFKDFYYLRKNNLYGWLTADLTTLKLPFLQDFPYQRNLSFPGIFIAVQTNESELIYSMRGKLLWMNLREEGCEKWHPNSDDMQFLGVPEP